MTEPVVVVTCFLRNAGEILLVRRSQDVSTYAGSWAGISGYVVTSDPERDARREIVEETGLPDSVQLVRAGASLDVADGDRLWRIYPFLFDLPDRRVELDHEADRAEWVMAGEILRRDCVPGLWDAYRRIAPSFEDVSLDLEHGSSYLAEEALQLLRDTASEAATAQDPRAFAVLSDLAERLTGSRPTMVAIANRLSAALSAAADRSASAIEDAAHAAIAEARRHTRLLVSAVAELVAGKRVMVFSRSESVLAALLEAHSTEVVVPASEPGREGMNVVRVLDRAGIPVVLIPDTSAASEILTGTVDLVITGADAILPSGDLINKTGTLGLALAAAERSIPFFVVSSLDKRRRRSDIQLESMPPAAIFPNVSLPMRANRFDLTPARYVTAYITESGAVPPAEIGQH